MAMDAIYPVSTEQIGKPDPLVPGYVGTYSPPALYAMAVIDEPSRSICVCDIHQRGHAGHAAC